MADISVIKLPSGSEYNIKDAWARQAIEGLGNPTHFLGKSTTAITDGGTQTPTIGGTEVTPHAGDIVVYNNGEFIWSGTAWIELGDLSGLGDLAYKDTASGKVTPTGTVSKPSFTGSSSTVTITATDNTSGNYQPKGSISGIAWKGASMTSSGKFTPAGSVGLTTSNKTATVSAATSGEATYTPAGTVTKPTFSGTAATINSSATYTPAGSVSLTKTNKTTTVAPASSGTATYTPGGTVGTPTISVKTAGSTTTIKNPTSKTVVTDMSTAAPAATDATGELKYYSIDGETLTLNKLVETTGASITTSNVTVKNGDAAYESSQPTWTGTGVRLVTGNISTADSASFSGTEATISSSASYTPAGGVSQPTFSGTGARLVTSNIAVPTSASFTGTEGDVSVSGTTTGSISSQGTFTGTKTQLSGTTTAAGSVSQPTFTGDEKTVTVS